MSSVVSPGTFQVSTDQVNGTGTSATGQRPQALGSSPSSPHDCRFDEAETHAPHPRATQLKEYTHWLKQQLSNAPSDVANSAADVVQSNQLESTTSNGVNSPGRSYYRIDAADQTASAPGVAEPHFDTRHYVEPKNRTSSNDTLPTDGFDPVIEIREEFQRLKDKGRIVGDLDQPSTAVEVGYAIPQFRWPSVTTSLVGSPAMLNLEFHVQNAITQHRKQVIVTSTRDGVGGSTIAMSLARQAATHGSRVLLIDGNIGNPKFACHLGLTQQISWLQAITEKRAPSQLIIKQKSTPISVMPLRHALHRVHWPRKIYDQFARIVNPLAWDYDLVIIDSGPTSQLIAESTSPKLQSAIVLLVNGNGPASDLDVQTAQSELLSFGMDRLLLVQNFSQIRAACAQAG